nr:MULTISPECIES: KTSC domain-containing protein [Pantoea]
MKLHLRFSEARDATRLRACRRWLAVPAKVYQAFCAAADSDTFFRTSIDGCYLSDVR